MATDRWKHLTLSRPYCNDVQLDKRDQFERSEFPCDHQISRSRTAHNMYICITCYPIALTNPSTFRLMCQPTSGPHHTGTLLPLWLMDWTSVIWIGRCSACKSVRIQNDHQCPWSSLTQDQVALSVAKSVLLRDILLQVWAFSGLQPKRAISAFSYFRRHVFRLGQTEPLSRWTQ